MDSNSDHNVCDVQDGAGLAASPIASGRLFYGREANEFASAGVLQFWCRDMHRFELVGSRGCVAVRFVGIVVAVYLVACDSCILAGSAAVAPFAIGHGS